MKQLIAAGAEAKIYADGKSIIKHRIKKIYRNPILDNKLRESRTKREAKILRKLYYLGFTPQLLTIKDNDKLNDALDDTLIIQRIDGEKLRDILSKENYKSFAILLAKAIKKMHDAGIIHGDLTTSNMIVTPDKRFYLIDFGLSFFSEKAEDKAVDLHLLKQTLDSKHYLIAKECFSLILKEYNDAEVINRLRKVEQRGRNKGS
ncbi:Kae1-associated serine/threonine protein kinase [Candidatus Woesearchaeota archaeon]|nr:Kae1-associated serine/threonine protein kinase [Candidatus Woesearchaeota archaeon]